jgi:ABC-type transport system involved in cytochrome bd biosynthesis fused ATPase/permease subunit
MSRGWHWSSRVLTASMLGAGAALAGIGLTGTAAWLISRAAEHPNVAALGVAIAGVRFFGISRALPLFRRGDLLARLVDDVDSLLKVSLPAVETEDVSALLPHQRTDTPETHSDAAPVPPRRR